MDTPTLAERARAAWQATELERGADRAAAYEAAAERAGGKAADLVSAWLADEGISVEAQRFTIGTMTAAGADLLRWRISVSFPSDDDSLDLVMVLDLGTSPYGATFHWLLPRTCARCGDAYAEHAGKHLADIGRALDRGPDHRCHAPAASTVIEYHRAEDEDAAPTAARIDALIRDGYRVTTLADCGWLVIVATPPEPEPADGLF